MSMGWGEKAHNQAKMLQIFPSHSVLPIVMGARPEDYARAAPYKSYIHVDQFSGPRDLAQFLLELDKDDQKYNQYFQVILILY